MNRSRGIRIGVTVAAALLTVALVWLWLHPPGAEEEEPGPETVARVQVVPLRQDRIEGTLMTYGMVVAPADKLQIISLPFESRVSNLLVMDGQSVAADAPLLEVEASPDARLGLRQAQGERDAAARELKLVEQRLAMQLATSQEQAQAKSRLDAATINLRSLETRGQGATRTIRASGAGLVSAIKVQKGQMVPAGETQIELIRSDQIEVRLGIEVDELGYLHPGQAVKILPVNTSEERAVEGTIRLITRQVNPETRLVDVFVSLKPGSRLLLNEYVRGQIVIAAENSLVAPQAAVLPVEGMNLLFTVADGHAKKHTVTLGVENDREVQVAGDGLAAGQQVVVVGNSELTDGMAVKVESGR
jgi:membrane fusion protein, multidrug efflux system